MKKCYFQRICKMIWIQVGIWGGDLNSRLYFVEFYISLLVTISVVGYIHEDVWNIMNVESPTREHGKHLYSQSCFLNTTISNILSSKFN